MNRAAFYSTLRKRNSGVFGTSLSQPAVDGMEAILGEAEYRKTPLRWLAYMLATVYRECGPGMQPVREGFAKSDARSRRIVARRKYGKPVPKHGNQVAYGRGLVQLTWSYNYERADKELKLGGRLIRDYDLALNEAVAAAIMFTGMEEGWFTTKKLADYLPNPVVTRKDYRNARRIINGTDKADLIAGYACAFDAALVAAQYPN